MSIDGEWDLNCCWQQAGSFIIWNQLFVWLDQDLLSNFRQSSNCFVELLLQATQELWLGLDDLRQNLCLWLHLINMNAVENKRTTQVSSRKPSERQRRPGILGPLGPVGPWTHWAPGPNGSSEFTPLGKFGTLRPDGIWCPSAHWAHEAHRNQLDNQVQARCRQTNAWNSEIGSTRFSKQLHNMGRSGFSRNSRHAEHVRYAIQVQGPRPLQPYKYGTYRKTRYSGKLGFSINSARHLQS